MTRSLYKEYEKLVILNEKLNKDNQYNKYLLKLNERKLINRDKKINTLKDKNSNLKTEILDLKKQIQEYEHTIARLTAFANMDGNNHGIPTAQTPINKKKIIPNTREKSELKKGGQVGHKKHKLEKLKEEEITTYFEHDKDSCPHCKSSAIKKTGEIITKDEIDFRIVVEKIRHEFPEYKCGNCGKTFHPAIPNRLKEENQYGAQVQALELSLMNQANVPINKAQKILYGMTNGEINLSEGYIAKLQKKAAKKLKPFKEELKVELLKQGLLHWDDTVIMINTKRSCLRFYGTENLAYYVAHLKKDKEGIDQDEILPLLSKDTVVMHDHNKVNYNKDYNFRNAECNRHLITDLKKVSENLKHKWAEKMIKLLTSMNNKRKWLIHKGNEEFEQEQLNDFEDKFGEIILQAYEENRNENPKRYYVDKEETLIDRIIEFKNEYLLWVYDFDIPFTNNLSERSLRGSKSKMKSAGQFWNEESANCYATIKTYIETCLRNKIDVFHALHRLSLEKPYTLKEILNKQN